MSALRPLLAVLLCAVSSLPPTRATRAADVTTIAVAGVHGDGNQSPADLEAIASDLVVGFKTAGFEVIHGAELGNRLASVRESIVDKVYLEPLRQGFDEGRILYEKAQPDLAVEALTRAWGEVEGAGEFIRDPRLTVDLQLFLGLSRIALGHEEEARNAFAEVVRMDPDRVLDTLDYPPRIVDIFDDVRAEVLRPAGASLAVEVDDGTSGARVFVDARMSGTTPTFIQDLPPGKHSILVDGGSEGRWYGELKLAEGEHRRLITDLEPRGLAYGTGDRFEGPRSGITRRLYRELAVAAGADLVAVAAFDEAGDFRIGLYSGRSATFSVSATASLAAAPGARSAFVRQLVERVALYADPAGAIRTERVAAETSSLRIGANPDLNACLFGRPAAAATAGPVEVPVARAPDLRPKRSKVAGTVVAIVAGVLGAGGAAAAIAAGIDAGQDVPAGVLVVTVP